MRTLYNSLKEITPKTREWKLKVIVAEKMMARTAIHSPNKYQRLILADTEGNRIQATIFGRDIQLFAETLHISNTYYIINALVKPIKPEHRIVQNEFQWTINSKTVIELASENEIQLPTLGLDFVPFTDFHKYINSLSQIDVIAVAIDAQAPRELQTKNGTTIIQELTLVDQDLKPICLTMWDHFVENESAMISNDIKSKPIIIGARLKVVSHNGMSLSTKSSSSFIINPNSSEANALHNWAIANESVLNDIIQNKSYLKASSSSTAASNRTITQIATIPELAKTQFSFWVKAKISVTNLQQTFWYMTCNKCSRSTGVEADETFACLNCKETDAVAQPRCRVEVELHDASDSLVASLFGEDAEKFLECSATKLMLYSTEEGITNIQSLARLSSEEEFIIRLRAALVDGRRGPRQRFNITTVQEPPNEDPSISATQ